MIARRWPSGVVSGKAGTSGRIGALALAAAPHCVAMCGATTLSRLHLHKLRLQQSGELAHDPRQFEEVIVRCAVNGSLNFIAHVSALKRISTRTTGLSAGRVMAL